MKPQNHAWRILLDHVQSIHPWHLLQGVIFPLAVAIHLGSNVLHVNSSNRHTNSRDPQYLLGPLNVEGTLHTLNMCDITTAHPKFQLHYPPPPECLVLLQTMHDARDITHAWHMIEPLNIGGNLAPLSPNKWDKRRFQKCTGDQIVHLKKQHRFENGVAIQCPASTSIVSGINWQVLHMLKLKLSWQKGCSHTTFNECTIHVPVYTNSWAVHL